jgi:hypothetical protein
VPEPDPWGVVVRDELGVARAAAVLLSVGDRQREVVALAGRRPDLGADRVALVVSAVLGMLNTTSHVESALGAEDRRTALRDLALAALLG